MLYISVLWENRPQFPLFLFFICRRNLDPTHHRRSLPSSCPLCIPGHHPAHRQPPMAALASSKDAPAGDMRMANINAAAVVRDYQVKPRFDYRTIAGVNGLLVILDNAKFPKYQRLST